MIINNNNYYDTLPDHSKNSWRILESYFKLKQQAPNSAGNLTSHPRTTNQIIDDLSQMCELNAEFVVDFMFKNGFGLENQPDGTPNWQIWEIEEGQF